MNNLTKSIGKGIGTFIAAIMIFLSTIFPNNKGLMIYRQERDNSLNIYGSVMMEAILNKDVPTMRDLMCANIKRNVKNLDQEIQNLYDLIEGETVSSKISEGASASFSGEKGTIEQSGINFFVTTTKRRYMVNVTWETVNNMKPEETKIRAIHLVEHIYDGDTFVRSDLLYEIVATEGVMKWHE